MQAGAEEHGFRGADAAVGVAAIRWEAVSVRRLHVDGLPLHALAMLRRCQVITRSVQSVPISPTFAAFLVI